MRFSWKRVNPSRLLKRFECSGWENCVILRIPDPPGKRSGRDGCLRVCIHQIDQGESLYDSGAGRIEGIQHPLNTLREIAEGFPRLGPDESLIRFKNP
ncbi:hypothetical protein DMENIID0001_112040 [Sergentomyia squamirostris]